MSITYLSQSDFSTGTFRIKQGGEYRLASDIVFNPPYDVASTRPDTPANGFWFCAISVETSEPVVIDGCWRTLSESDEYQEANLVGIYSNILLGNNSFSGSLFGASESFYPDTTAYVAANNVTLKRIVLGASSHFGVRGQNNSNIVIRNCAFRDNRFACINLQGCVNFEITDNTFEGVKKSTTVTVEDSQLYLVRLILSSLVQFGVPGAAEYLANLNIYVEEHPERFDRVVQYPSNFYGIFINAGLTSIFPFPINEQQNALGQALSGGRPSTNGKIENNHFSDMQVSAFERIGLNSNDQNGITTSIQLTLFGMNGVLEWQDAFATDSTTFSPNPFLQALCFVIAVFYPQLPDAIKALLPVNTPVIAQSVLQNDATTFFQNAAPILGLGDDTNLIKGLFGIRLSGSNNIQLRKNKMCRFSSTGPKPLTTNDIKSYSLVTNPLPVVRFEGNDVWFVGAEICDQIDISDISCKDMKTRHGYAHAIHFANLDSNIKVSCTKVKNVKAPNKCVTQTMDAGETFGFEVENEAGSISIYRCTTKCLKAGGEVEAFPKPSENVTVKKSRKRPCKK